MGIPQEEGGPGGGADPAAFDASVAEPLVSASQGMGRHLRFVLFSICF
jgi:hypothetical protein